MLEISGYLRKWSEVSRKLPSVEQEKFQSGVCQFVEYMTGRKDLEYQGAVDVLRDLAGKRSNQWSILHNEMKEKDSEITRQKQIITCLEYRHVLENLPNKSCSHFVAKGDSATSRWKETWKLAVELKLDNMISDHIISRNPSQPGTTPPAPPSRLRPLLQRDFDFWASKRLAKASIPAPGVSTTSSPLLVQHYQPPYVEWSIYQRGATLYNELSSTIHGYGEFYETDESSWAKSDRLIFGWLRPNVNPGFEVDWDQE